MSHTEPRRIFDHIREIDFFQITIINHVFIISAGIKPHRLLWDDDDEKLIMPSLESALGLIRAIGFMPRNCFYLTRPNSHNNTIHFIKTGFIPVQDNDGCAVTADSIILLCPDLTVREDDNFESLFRRIKGTPI